MPWAQENQYSALRRHVSDLLEQDKILNENLIVQYLRTDDMARKVSYLINNVNKKNNRLYLLFKSEKLVYMKDYVCKLDWLGTIFPMRKHLKKQEEYLKTIASLMKVTLREDK